MPSVPLSTLRTTVGRLKEALTAANRNGDPDLTTYEVRKEGRARDDHFVTGNAMQTVFAWAAHGLKPSSRANLAYVLEKADAALAAAERRDVNHNDVIDEGPELSSASRLKTFDALYDMAELPAFDPGMALYELMERSTVSAKRRYHAPEEVPASLKEALIAATNEATYVATTLEEAFSQVDQNEFVVRYAKDPVSDRSFIVVDFGAGDSTYGAIFDRATRRMLAGIQDGEVVNK